MGSRIGQRGVGRGAELIQEAGPSSLAPEREQHRMAASGQRHQSCCFPYLKCNKNNVLPFKVRPHSHLSILGTRGEMCVSAYVFGNMCIICFVLVVPFFFKATPNVGCGPAFCHTKKAQNRDKQKHLAQSQKKKRYKSYFGALVALRETHSSAQPALCSCATNVPKKSEAQHRLGVITA